MNKNINSFIFKKKGDTKMIKIGPEGEFEFKFNVIRENNPKKIKSKPKNNKKDNNFNNKKTIYNDFLNKNNEDPSKFKENIFQSKKENESDINLFGFENKHNRNNIKINETDDFKNKIQKNIFYENRKINPLKLYEIIDEQPIELQLKKIIDYSLDYFELKNSDLKESCEIIRKNIKFEFTDEKTELKKINEEIEITKSEFEKWKSIFDKLESNRYNINIDVNNKEETKIYNEKYDDMYEQFIQKKKVLNRIDMVIEKFLINGKNNCEEMFKRIFSSYKNKNINPVLLLKELAKLKN